MRLTPPPRIGRPVIRVALVLDVLAAAALIVAASLGRPVAVLPVICCAVSIACGAHYLYRHRRHQ